MPTAQECKRSNGPEQGPGHIRLGIPFIALEGQESIRGGAGQERHPPLNQFIERTDGQADTDHDEPEPIPPNNNLITQQDFPGDNRRDKALGNMPELVVIVT